MVTSKISGGSVFVPSASILDGRSPRASGDHRACSSVSHVLTRIARDLSLPPNNAKVTAAWSSMSQGRDPTLGGAPAQSNEGVDSGQAAVGRSASVMVSPMRVSPTRLMPATT